tara:strand:+ start:1277 stop:2506 length:1230 start_codon:yes stop_codon:yes gene_type:complete
MTNNKKNWLVVTQYFPPEIGAPQIRLLAMIKELQRKNIEVKVLTAMPNYPKGEIFKGYKNKFTKTEIIDGIEIKRMWIYPYNSKSPILRLLNYFSFTFTAVIGILSMQKPDMIFIESQPLSLGITALLMKRLKRVPYIYNIPDLQIEMAKELGYITNGFFLKLSTLFENHLMKHSWKVSTVTNAFAEHLNSRGIEKKKITFLPNGADSDFLKPKSADKRLLSKWRLANKKVILYAGTHTFYNGFDSIIGAADILKDNKDIVFLMIGGGPERKRIMRMVEQKHLDNVIFEQSPYSERPDLYSIAYASLASLKKIPIFKKVRPAKIFPSLSCAVPVVYAGVGEAADLLKKNQCGISVEPENPVALANAISMLVNDPELRNRLGNSGRILIEKQYSWKIIVENWLKNIETKL